MLIGYASIARHREGLTFFYQYALQGVKRSMLIGYASIARHLGGLSIFIIISPSKVSSD